MTDASARQDILDEIAASVDDIAFALASVGEAYDQLEENTADRLEEALFGPLQRAYGRAQRTHNDFAARVGLATRQFAPGHAGVAHGAAGPVNDAVEAVESADARLAELQDSMTPIEFGDQQLRADLSETRQILGDVPARAREFLRTLGR